MRCTTACNNRCLFCLDADAPRDVHLPEAAIREEIDRGIGELGASKLVLSGGEATLHPRFCDLVRHAKARGYARVQCITNGARLASRAFFEECVAAGLDEITFSLHGHTAELHDRLTRRAGSFDQLVRGMSRAARDGRVVVNVDVCLNRQNIDHLDAIVGLCLSLGVGEFDLLHVIPHGEAFRNREALLYDAVGNPTLRRVLRLSRHPRVTLWTNRLPVAALEGFEELVQAPEKLLDEVNGRRAHVRRYLDLGEPLECRDPRRCVHCFVEPFCTSMDRAVGLCNVRGWEVWWLGDGWADAVAEALPFGCRRLGVDVASIEDLPEAARRRPLYVRERAPSRPPVGLDAILVADTPAHLDAYLGGGPPTLGGEVEVRLDRRTASWLLAHQDRLAAASGRVRLLHGEPAPRQRAGELGIDDPLAFFAALVPGLRVAGLPPCMVPGARWVPPRRVLDRALFDPRTGRLDMMALARHHIAQWYLVKSARCRDCRVDAWCEGIHVDDARRHGLRALDPARIGPDEELAARLSTAWPEPRARVATGRRPEPAAEGLPGFGPPSAPPEDPLSRFVAERGGPDPR